VSVLRRLFPVICLIFTIGIVKPSYAAPVVELLRNSGFEGSFRSLEEKNGSARLNGEIGDGWSDDSSWAEVTAIYRRDTTRPHGGATAQRIEVQEVRRGAVQMRQTIQGLKPGLRYTYRIWLRGRSDTPAIVFLQQTAAPYSALSARMVRLSDVWVPVTIPLKAAEGETEVAAMVRLGGTGTLWVDDARFVEGTLPTPSEANWQAAPDNLLPNGSFEAGLGAGWGAVSDNNITESRPIIDETAALIGRRSLRMDIMAPAPHFPGTVMDVHSPEVLVEPGMEYTVSVALKASLPNTQVALGLDGVSDRQYVMAGPEWQRFSFTRRPTTKSTRVLIVCYVDKATQVWMDAVQLQAGVRAAPEYQAQSPLELNLSTRRPGNVFHDGEDARLEITTGGAKTLPAGATLRSQVIDLYGTERSLPVVRLPAAALVIPPAAEQPRGLFKVRSQVVDTAGKPLSAPVECVWSRLPRPRDIAAEKSFFGSHFILTPEFCAIARAVGVRWVRLHDSSKITKWPMTEPQPGDWRFYDEGVQTARAAGVQILGMLDGAPAWASARKGVKHDDYFANHFAVPDAPGAIDSWRRYVSTVVGHYAGKIDYWEVWNEPWNRDPPFFLGTPALYGELLKAAYPTAKAANPKSTVIGIDTYPGHGDAFAEGAMQASGPAFYDIFSYHDYRGALKVGPTRPPCNTRGSIALCRKNMARLSQCGSQKVAPAIRLRSILQPET
jgi:hypothetical protein